MRNTAENHSHISVIFICLFLCGFSACTNFRAYYNTYYNAKKNFKEGLKKVRDQPRQIDPAQFISLHPSPLPAGKQNFQEAVDNAAQILRRFPSSEWVDNALFLIGKSYYYQQKFYPALQKFEAILNLSRKSELKQQAVLWKARTLFEIGSYRLGINFLKDQLSVNEKKWSFKQKAKVNLLLAEHLAMAGQLQIAADTLRLAIPNLENEMLQGRSYFLLGQLYLRLKEYNKAYQSFITAARYNLDYDILYYSKIKAANSAGLAGHTTLAASVYEKMLNDNKNYERRGQIIFHLGRIAEQDGEYKKAEKLYRRILFQRVENFSDSLLANTYYRLARLHSKRFQNYRLAAAYFDSSKAVRRQTEGNNSNTATAYGRYVTLKAEISRIDSLLWLSSLSPAAFDSAIAIIKRQKQALLRRQLQINNPDDNTLTNVSIESEEVSNVENASSFGFLNYKSKKMRLEGIRQFRSVWGGRPLVDNWRRINAVLTVSIINENRVSETDATNGIEKIGQNGDQKETILEEIPFTPQKKKMMLEQKTMYQYQLGNLFFLALDKPDSAVVYYKKVISKSESQSLIPKALFSLYQLQKLEGGAKKAAKYRKAILEKYPGSIYASRVGRDINSGAPNKVDAKPMLREKVHYLLSDTTLTTFNRAKRLEQLALANKTSSLAPSIFYRSLKEYIKTAKTSTYSEKDSLNDKYTGKYWSKVRTMSVEFQKLFPESSHNKQVAIWAKAVKKSSQILTCQQTGLKPKVAGGMQTFISKIELPQKLKKMKLTGSLAYEIVINKRGEVEGYELISKPTGFGIEAAYSEAIENSLGFEPVVYEGEAVRISCEIAFPIKQ